MRTAGLLVGFLYDTPVLVCLKAKGLTLTDTSVSQSMHS